MRTLLRYIPVFTLAALSFAQPSPEGITVTVSRQLPIAPTEAQFLINIAADGSTTIEQVIAIVRPLGLSAQDLTSVTTFPYGGPFPYTGPPDPSKVNYIFRLAVPTSRVKETVDRINRLRRELDAGMDLQQQMIGIGPAAADIEQARKSILSALLAEARKRAEELADAGGVKLGAVQGVLESPSPFGPSLGYGPVQATYVYTLTVRYATQ